MHPTIPIIDTNNSYVLCINNSFSCIQFKTWFMLHIFSKAYISWHAKTFYYAFICSCVHNISYIFTNAKTHVTCPWYFLLVLNLLLILLLSHLPFYLYLWPPLASVNKRCLISQPYWPHIAHKSHLPPPYWFRPQRTPIILPWFTPYSSGPHRPHDHLTWNLNMK